MLTRATRLCTLTQQVARSISPPILRGVAETCPHPCKQVLVATGKWGPEATLSPCVQVHLPFPSFAGALAANVFRCRP
ncbi:hypothetical protein PSPO01_01145 [Paraphaeosphaeria sporulosa]